MTDRWKGRSSATAILALAVLLCTATGVAAASPSGGSRATDLSSALTDPDLDKVAPRTFTLLAKAAHTASAVPQAAGPRALSVLLQDDFEGAYLWESGSFTDAKVDTSWGRTDKRAAGGYYSGYCAMVRNPNAPYYIYPNFMNGYMARGPFDLTASTAARLEFDMWLDSEKDCDLFKIYYSLNGINFTRIDAWSGYSAGWLHKSYDLSNLCGSPQVWIAFGFGSDGSGNAEGAFVDNVTLTKSYSYDATPPTTVAVGAGTGWHRRPVTVRLNASDEWGGSGVASTMCSLNGAPFRAASWVRLGQGIHTIRYYSVDLAGNVEATKTVVVKVDLTRPTPVAYGGTLRRYAWGSLRYKILDMAGARVNVTVKMKDSRGRVLATTTFKNQPANRLLVARYNPGSDPAGTYWFSVSARDLAGNVGTRTAIARVLVR